ncbi:MAG: ABC superfamily ATP binding cassette transporter, ABC protein, partial [Actinomyces urogenitalis DORA_12]
QRDGQEWTQVEALGSDEPVLSLDAVSVDGRCPEVSLSVGAGELVAVVGTNGSGKSSLLRALVGTLRSRGTIRVGGHRVRKGRHLADYVYQNPEHQFVSTTVAREVAVSHGTQGVEELLGHFRLSEYRAKHPMTLSGGEARRLSVATVSGSQRPVLLLDEPTYGQDEANATELLGFIQERQHSGQTVVMATHDIDAARRYATKIVVLPEPQAKDLPTQVEQDDGYLHPFTLLVGLIPFIVALLVVRSLSASIATLVAATLAALALGRTTRHKTGLVATMWAIPLLLSVGSLRTVATHSGDV